MKQQIITVVFVFVLGIANAQNLTTIKQYYDPYTKTQLNEVYSVIAGTNTRHGLYKSYDRAGILLEEGSYKNGKSHGTWKTYYGVTMASLYNDPVNWRGKLWEIRNYSNGNVHGYRARFKYPKGVKQLDQEWTYENNKVIKEVSYYENGNKKSIFQVNGECKEWNEKGILITEHIIQNGDLIKSIGYYDNGQKQLLLQLNGDCGEWFENGSKKKEYKHIDGEIVGTCKEWHRDGQLMSDKIYDKNSILISENVYFNNGKPKSTFHCDSLICKKLIYDSLTGQNIEQTFFQLQEIDGRIQTIMTGEQTFFYANGNVKSSGMNQSEEKHGKWIFYYEDGRKKEEGTFSSNRKVGIWNSYFNNDTIESTGAYDNNYKAGAWNYYFDNGVLKSTGTYDSYGKQTGLWRYYDASGNLEYTEESKGGSKVKKTAEQIRKENEEIELAILRNKTDSLKTQFSENRKKIERLYGVQEKDEVVVSGVIITPKKVVATKKKNLYEAFLIVEKELEEQINATSEVTKIYEMSVQKCQLSENVILLFSTDTKALEKQLKKIKDPNEIMKLISK